MPSARRRRTVALLFDSLTSEYAVYLRRAVERAATRRDVSLLVVAGQPLGAPEAVLVTQNQIYDVIGPRRVDGVIVVTATIGHYAGHDGLVAFCQSYAPLPVCSLGVQLAGVPSLVIDNAGGMQAGVEHLMAVHDCRRIAFIAGPKASDESNLRLEGYRQAHRERGLALDDELIRFGDFTLDTGAACMKSLMERGAGFDAVCAANDDMALGALDVLKAAGVHVPRDVVVSGFDDINSAHFARPSLSTLRQPMWWLGERAIDTMLRQIEGERVEPLQAGRVDFVRRESCGCGYQVGITVFPTKRCHAHARQFIDEHRTELAAVMRAAVTLPNDALGEWPTLLLEALDLELSGKEGQFGSAFEEVLDHAQREGASLDEFQRVVSVIRAEFRRVEIEDQEDLRQLERVWHNARVLVGAASIRLLGRQKLEQQQVTTWLSWVGERLATTLSLSLLKEQLIEALPRLQILRGSIALYTGPRSHELEVLVAVKDGVAVAKSGVAFPEVDLAPDEILADDRCLHFVVMPISFETQLLGVALLESGGLPSVYEGLRQQIASAVKGAMMHHEIIAQVTLRERLEAERMAEEARVAASIQTSMAPVQMQVQGLEIAGLMAPAAESGGDYYDVLPTRDGAWLAIGDVTGHGLGAGLIMLMLQSMISSLSRVEPALTPSELLCTVGDAIWDNVRQRLRRDDHATLTVLHYFGRGRFVFAGAHEEMIVWRKRTGLCETIPTPGFWVGALPSIRRMTQDSELLLEAGDLLVLYTDGVTEARNAHHEQFSLERLVRLVEERGKSPVNVLRDAIRDVVLSWSSSVDDDMTLLLIRYVGEV